LGYRVVSFYRCVVWVCTPFAPDMVQRFRLWVWFWVLRCIHQSFLRQIFPSILGKLLRITL
jgi:hypothetical protein